MNLINNTASLVGRILLGGMFINAGMSKLGEGYAQTQGYMEMMGVSGSLLPLVIATEILAGIALLVGFQTRIAAFLLAGFTLLAAALFHFDFSDPMQQILFMKNLAISGGLLAFVANGSSSVSIDNLRPRGA